MSTAPAPLALPPGPAAADPEPSPAPPAEPPAAPAQASRAAPDPAAAGAGKGGRVGETTQRLRVRPAPTAPSEALMRVSAIARAAGQPSSVTVTLATHDVHVNTPDAATFLDWCEHLRLSKSQIRRLTRRTGDYLGELAEVSVADDGWTLHIRLFGPASKEIE